MNLEFLFQIFIAFFCIKGMNNLYRNISDRYKMWPKGNLLIFWLSTLHIVTASLFMISNISNKKKYIKIKQTNKLINKTDNHKEMFNNFSMQYKH